MQDVSSHCSDGLIGVGGDLKVLRRMLVVGGVTNYEIVGAAPHCSVITGEKRGRERGKQ